MELVPIWKIHGFTGKCGCKAKDEDDLSEKKSDFNVRLRKNTQFIYPHADIIMNKPAKQTTWERQLSHRSRSTSP